MISEDWSKTPDTSLIAKILPWKCNIVVIVSSADWLFDHICMLTGTKYFNIQSLIGGTMP